MKALIDSIVIATYLLAITVGGKYTLSKTYNFIQRAALEKVATGLGDLEPITQKMTGKKLNF